MNIYTCLYDYRPEELYHYGVKGMKWGVRRDTVAGYRSKSNAAVAEISSRKTRLGKSLANRKAYRNEVKANKKALQNANENEKNLLKRVDNTYGHGAVAAEQKAAANYYSRKAGYTKTKRGTNIAKANAYNARTAAEANQKLHDSKSAKEYGKNYVDAISKRKVKTYVGRTTTAGEQYLDMMFTGGIYGAVKDRMYYVKNK